MTFLGGGGMTLPGMTMFLGAIGAGGFGGLSRIKIGAGVSGSGGFWVTWSGGAGGAWTSDSWVIVMSPGCCGGGGFKNLRETFWTCWTREAGFFLIKIGLGSTLSLCCSVGIIGTAREPGMYVEPAAMATGAEAMTEPLVAIAEPLVAMAESLAMAEAEAEALPKSA